MDDYRQFTDEELIAVITSQSPEWETAWEELMERRYGSLLRGIARRKGFAGHLQPPHYREPSELTGELLVHLRGRGDWKRLRSYRPQDGKPFAQWLKTVASRLAGLRTRRPAEESPPVISWETVRECEGITLITSASEWPPDNDLDAVIVAGELRQLVDLAVTTLPKPAWQEIARRRVFGGEEWREIADALGLKVENIRQKWSRNIRPALEKALREWGVFIACAVSAMHLAWQQITILY